MIMMCILVFHKSLSVQLVKQTSPKSTLSCDANIMRIYSSELRKYCWPLNVEHLVYFLVPRKVLIKQSKIKEILFLMEYCYFE